VSALEIVPMTVKRASAWVDVHHSHHKAPRGGLFAVGVAEGKRLCCIALAGRPVARLLDTGATIEITRSASDRTPHAASKAIAAITRGALSLGYRRLVSYTLLGEAGTCYRAAGWHVTGLSQGGEWDRAGRGRGAAAQPGAKVRWEYGPDALPLDPIADATMRAAIGNIAIPTRALEVAS